MFVVKAVEKKNDICKAIYFKASNKLKPSMDIVVTEQRKNNLSPYARRKRSYM